MATGLFVPRPVRIPAAGEAPISPEQRLLQRAGFGFSPELLMRLPSLRYDDYLEGQLALLAIDDSAVQEVVDQQFPAVAAGPSQLWSDYQDAPEIVLIQLLLSTLYRAVYSERQLFERMVLFWSDHFHVDLYSTHAWYQLAVQDREVVRRHALGRFPELLAAAARSPALLSYLTNTGNRTGAINENFARELLELHTMGEGSGYTEEDVREVARCFTGWSVVPPDAGTDGGTFRFFAADHDGAAKRVLGHLIPAGGGIEDGERVLEILAEHPATARHLAQKLVAAFWGESPAAALVDEVAASYVRSGGSVPEMLRCLLQRSHLAEAPPLFKRPLELTVSLLRGLGAESFDPFFLVGMLIDAGHLPFAWPRPDGYPMRRSYWAGALLPRWRLALGLVEEAISGVRLHPSLLEPAGDAAEWVRRIDWRLANGAFNATTRSKLEELLGPWPSTPERIRRALALALAAPELQEA